jgi:hypothetical protein
MYSTDGSNYRQIPIGLVVPRDADDVVAAMAACRKYGAPVWRAERAQAWRGSAAMSPWCSISPST